jgi:glycosyltransferase involved in cell wall biosynthesis
VRKVLFVIPSLDYGGAARQLTLLAAGLPREHFHARVAVLGPAAPWAASLRAAGVEVDVLGWNRVFDPRPFLALRGLVRSFAPDVVHAWGLPAVRALALTGSRSPGQVLFSAAFPEGRPPGLLDRHLLRQVRGGVALGEAEAERYRRAGVPAQRVTVASPGVGGPTAPEDGPAAVASLPGLGRLPAGARVVLGIGPLQPHKGFREAVWTLDILHYLYPDLHLVLAGAGPDRSRVEAFARATGTSARVHFTGPCADLAPLLRRAELVWVPCLREGGVGATLEAMAAGRPVVASRWPRLAEVVADGVTGYLIEPGDKAALARQTRALLDDAGRREQFGAAARQRAAGHFGADRVAERCATLYEGSEGSGQTSEVRGQKSEESGPVGTSRTSDP